VKPSDFEVFEALGKDCIETGHADESFVTRCGMHIIYLCYCNLNWAIEHAFVTCRHYANMCYNIELIQALFYEKSEIESFCRLYIHVHGYEYSRSKWIYPAKLNEDQHTNILFCMARSNGFPIGSQHICIGPYDEHVWLFPVKSQYSVI